MWTRLKISRHYETKHDSHAFLLYRKYHYLIFANIVIKILILGTVNHQCMKALLIQQNYLLPAKVCLQVLGYFKEIIKNENFIINCIIPYLWSSDYWICSVNVDSDVLSGAVNAPSQHLKWHTRNTAYVQSY